MSKMWPTMNRKPVKEPKLTEADIQKTCTELLELDGWRALRTDPVSRREWGKGFGELGMADRLYIRYGLHMLAPLGSLAEAATPLTLARACEVMWIEWKRTVRGKPTKPTTHQLAWHRAERARGALTLIAGENFPATIKGFMEWYKSSGLQRR